MYVKCERYEKVISRTLLPDISDHFPILTCMGSQGVVQSKRPLSFRQRKMGPSQIHKVSETLKMVDWDEMFRYDNVSKCYDSFIAHFTDILNTHAPEVKTSIPYKAIIREAWMTPGLIKSSRKKEHLYTKTFGKPRNSIQFENYLKFRNLYNIVRRQAKSQYYKQLLQKYSTDIRKTWKVLNSIMGRTNDKSCIPDTFIVDNSKITDANVIANGFGSYFSNIRKTLAESIPKSIESTEHYMKTGQNKNSIYLNPTHFNEILKILGKCKNKKSTGDDGISMALLKQLCEDICVPIAKLVNMSLEQGVVSDAMKLAKVMPIHKAKSKQLFTNYRPIALLSNMSKILEKVIHNHMMEFLVKHDILYNKQFGFRPGHSTTDAIHTLTCDALRGFDDNASCLSVYLDMSKAFDTINHNILMNKLNHYGIRGIALQWFRSYLSQRTQYVSYNGVKSELYDISYGVPQGSALGPLLFIIYSDDIQNAIMHSKTVLFADDTTVYLVGHNISELQTELCINL